MKLRHLFAVLVFLSPLAAQAQDADSPSNNQASESDNNRRFWQADIPGGAYVVAIDRIAAVGKHQYLLGTFLVTEVTVDTVGSTVARFYYGEPYRPDVPSATGQTVNRRVQETVDLVKERSGAAQTDDLVIRNYPTYAHTIEFRMNNKENLDALFQSVNRAWMTGRGVKFTVKTE